MFVNPDDPCKTDAGVAVLFVYVMDGMRRSTFLARRGVSADGFQGQWCCPGGKPRYGEPFRRAAQREVQEETGLPIALDRFHDHGMIVIVKGGVRVPVVLFVVELKDTERPMRPEAEANVLGDWQRFELDTLARRGMTDLGGIMTPGTLALVGIMGNAT
jgi:8-oxo-dGTP pyrophosphatase MutT (NUDIX family)